MLNITTNRQAFPVEPELLTWDAIHPRNLRHGVYRVVHSDGTPLRTSANREEADIRIVVGFKLLIMISPNRCEQIDINNNHWADPDRNYRFIQLPPNENVQVSFNNLAN